MRRTLYSDFQFKKDLYSENEPRMKEFVFFEYSKPLPAPEVLYL